MKKNNEGIIFFILLLVCFVLAIGSFFMTGKVNRSGIGPISSFFWGGSEKPVISLDGTSGIFFLIILGVCLLIFLFFLVRDRSKVVPEIYYICPKCETARSVDASQDLSDNLCLKCGANLVALKGFYDKNKQEPLEDT